MACRVLTMISVTGRWVRNSASAWFYRAGNDACCAADGERQAAETRSSVAHSDRWQGYVWQIWQPRQAALGGQVPDNQPLTLRLPPPQEWPPTAEPAADPDILLLPGGEITPFTLIFGEKDDRSEVWLRVDESGAIATSAKGGAP